MSDLELDPRELRAVPSVCEGSAELLTPRDVPLGGPRAMTVRRTLPQRRRSLIGPWCFVDHFGPDDVSATGGMAVPRHPHTGLATVTLLFRGHIEHLDSTGFANTVRPGEVNLMIAGAGVSHSEFSTADTAFLHGVQLWYALPDALRHGAPQSQHHVAVPVAVPGGDVLTYLGHLAGIGEPSPIDTRTPALAAEVTVRPGASVSIDLDPAFEHGLLLDSGDLEVTVEGTPEVTTAVDPEFAAASGSGGDSRIAVSAGDLLYLAPAARGVRLRSPGDRTARIVLIGGPPLGEDIVMWWNFVGRSHAEIVRARERWMAEISTVPHPTDVFGPFPAGTPGPLPAPALPHAELRPRRRPGGTPS